MNSQKQTPKPCESYEIRKGLGFSGRLYLVRKGKVIAQAKDFEGIAKEFIKEIDTPLDKRKK